jgi:hypothetical protein
MLPFIRRSWKTKTRTQSSEHGVIATAQRSHFLGSLFVKGHVLFLSGPEAMEQHGQLTGDGDYGLALGLFPSTSCQMETPLSEC